MTEENTQENEGTETQEQDAAPDRFEEEARGLGWVPKEEYVAKGKDESNWRPAKEFIEYGERSAYILKQQLEKYKEENQRLHSTLEDVKDTVKGMNERALVRAKQELLMDIAEAEKNSDFGTYNQKLIELADLEQSNKKEPKKEEKTEKPTIDPYLDEWVNDPQNRWFREDPDLNTQATIYYGNLERKYPQMSTKELVTMTEKYVIDKNPDKFEVKKKGYAAAESGSGSLSKKGGKTFSDIPQKDREAMEKMMKHMSFYGKNDKDSMKKMDEHKQECVEAYFGK